MAAYIQRIYDAGSPPEVPPRWVYYTKWAIDPSPLSGETSPAHTGNIVSYTGSGGTAVYIVSMWEGS